MCKVSEPTKTEILLYLATQVMGWKFIAKSTLDGMWSEDEKRTKMVPGSKMHKVRKKIRIHDEPGDGYLWDPTKDLGDAVALGKALNKLGFGVEIFMPDVIPYDPRCLLSVDGIRYSRQSGDSIGEAMTGVAFKALTRAAVAFDDGLLPSGWKGDKQPKTIGEAAKEIP